MTSGRSLRGRLTLAVVGVLGVSLAGFSWILDAAVRRVVWGQFDAGLAEDASAVAGMVEVHRDGRLEFEAAALPGFEAEGGRAYYEVWKDDGSVFARSPSLRERDLGRHAKERLAADLLPGGRPGRTIETRFLPRRDQERPAATAAELVVVVGRETADVAAAIGGLRALLGASGLTAVVVAGLAGALAIGRGLRPLRRLRARTDAIDARQLSTRLPTDDLPSELRPTVVTLNGLLARLEASFERERRLSADASHELRTPLAGLRSTLEVALSRQRPAAAYREAMEEALAVVGRMSALVESLLALARLDHEPEPSCADEIALHALVDECRGACTERLLARSIAFENSVACELRLRSDRERVRVVVMNLLTNAAAYTAEGGRVVVSSDPARGVWLEVADSGPAVPEHALPKIFDRFYRADVARSATGEHWGIGLALVRALCETLGLAVTAENRSDGWVTFQVRRDVSGPAAPRA